MPSDKLYDAAVRFKRAKVWNLIDETDLFAVRLESGELAYCYVTGILGEQYSLVMHLGDRGFDSLRRYMTFVHQAREYDPRVILLLDCVTCSLEEKDYLRPSQLEEARAWAKRAGKQLAGAHAFPCFTRHTPGLSPYPLKDAALEDALLQCLEAAIWIGGQMSRKPRVLLPFRPFSPEEKEVMALEMDGEGYRCFLSPLPGPVEEDYPTPALEDELLAAKVKKLPHRRTMEAGVFYSVYTPIADPEGEEARGEDAAYFPVLLMLVDSQSRIITYQDLLRDMDDVAAKGLSALASHWLEEKAAPRTIKVSDPRTRSLLSGLCAQCGILLSDVPKTPALDEAVEGFYRYTDQMDPDEDEWADDDEEDWDDDEDWEDEDPLDELTEEDISFLFQMPLELSQATLKKMPGILKKLYMEINEAGLLPKNCQQALKKAGILPRG